MGLPAGAPGATGLLLSGTREGPALVVAAMLAAAYGLGVRRVRARGLGWPVRRTLAWGAGLATLLLATVGGVGAYAHALLWVFALQVLLLLLLVPVLLTYGRPLALAGDALPERSAARVLRAAQARPVRLLTSPLVGPVVVPVVLGVVFFSPLLHAGLTSAAVDDVLQAGLLAVGGVIALGLVGDGTEHESALALGAAVAVGLGEFLLDAVPGIVVRLRTHLLATSYWTGLHLPWAPSPLVGQQHAGAVLWFVAEFGDLPLLVILVRRWVRADARETALEDRQLDELEASAPRDEQGRVRPWWEG